MLTIFDYLKYRARQSVVQGVQEAVQQLETEKVAAEKNAAVNGQQLDFLFQSDTAGHLTGQSKDAKKSPESAGNLPPRKRGRPKKQPGA